MDRKLLNIRMLLKAFFRTRRAANQDDTIQDVDNSPLQRQEGEASENTPQGDSTSGSGSQSNSPPTPDQSETSPPSHATPAGSPAPSPSSEETPERPSAERQSATGTTPVHASYVEHTIGSPLSAGGNIIKQTFINPHPALASVLAGVGLSVGMGGAGYFVGRTREMQSTSRSEVRLEYCERELISAKDIQYHLLSENYDLKHQLDSLNQPNFRNDTQEEMQQPPPVQNKFPPPTQSDVTNIVLMDYLIRYLASDGVSFISASAARRQRQGLLRIGWKQMFFMFTLWNVLLGGGILSR